MSENYWKDAYRDTWEKSSPREVRLAEYLSSKTGFTVEVIGLGAGSTEYIPGNAGSRNHQKGDADLHVVGTDIYIEVTGPLTPSVKSSAPLWFRPDKVENAINNPSHKTFFAHNCVGDNTWRVIAVDDTFKRRYLSGEFPEVTPVIRNRRELYIEVDASDSCILPLGELVRYIQASGG